jgi:predicted Abi (CAAX) family protease
MDTLPGTSRPQVRVIAAFGIAACAACLGWVGLRHVPYIETVPGLEIFLGVIAMPGIFTEVIFTAMFSTHGIHDDETFAWVVTPSNLVLYFTFALLVMKMFRGERRTNSPE